MVLSDVALVPYSDSGEVFCPFYLPGTPAEQEFDAAGYVQEEYFLSGSGKVYGPGEAPLA